MRRINEEALVGYSLLMFFLGYVMLKKYITNGDPNCKFAAGMYFVLADLMMVEYVLYKLTNNYKL